MKKRLLSILLVFVIVLSALPIPAFAEDGGEAAPTCICETACTAEAMNEDCPVCGAEGAHLHDCAKYVEGAENPAIDDIQFIIGKESTQEEFFHTFNALYEAKKQIIISSDRPPREIETLEDRLRSRFEWGLTVDIQPPDYETRMAILRKKEELDGVSLDDAILNYIALNIKSNIRELEGALNKLVAYENLVQTEITMEIAEKELQNIISPDIPLEVTPQLVVEVVAEHFGITMDQITSKSRSNDVAKPRQIAMYLCKNMTDASLETIGKAVGGRDHSTVVHGIKKVGDDISTDTSVERLVATIRKKINPH